MLIRGTKERFAPLYSRALLSLLRGQQNISAGLFGAAISDRVVVPQAPSINSLSSYSLFLKLFPTTLTSGRAAASKFGAGLAGWLLRLQATDKLELFAGRATTNTTYRVNTALTVNAWWDIIVTFDVAATPTTHFYMAKLGSLLVEPTYSTATDGSGALNADAAANFCIGNRSDSFTVAFQGRIAATTLKRGVAARDEREAWVAEPWIALPECRGLWLPGGGPGKVIDWSGYGNHGTPTGTALAKGPQLALPRRHYPVLAAATTATVLTVQDMLVALGIESPALTQANVLAVADASVALAVESPALTQANTLAAQDALVALAAESPGLTQANILAVADALIALSAESPALTQANLLAVADALVALATESPTLTQASLLAVADALVGLNAESAVLTQQNVLSVADALVALAAESPTLSTVSLGSFVMRLTGSPVLDARVSGGRVLAASMSGGPV